MCECFVLIKQLIGMEECLQRVNGMIEEAKELAGIDVKKPLASLVRNRK